MFSAGVPCVRRLDGIPGDRHGSASRFDQVSLELPVGCALSNHFKFSNDIHEDELSTLQREHPAVSKHHRLQMVKILDCVIAILAPLSSHGVLK